MAERFGNPRDYYYKAVAGTLPAPLPRRSDSAVLTSLAAASLGASTQVAAASTTRKGVTIVNNSTVTIYLGYGSTVPTTTLFNWSLAAGEKWECPFGLATAIQVIGTNGSGTGAVLTTVYS